VQLLHQMWPRRSTIAELVPHCATPGEFSVPHHPESPSPGSLKNITPLLLPTPWPARVSDVKSAGYANIEPLPR